MLPDGTQTLDCQDCGDVVRVLTDAEAQAVARNPYNFVVYCPACGKAREQDGCFEIDRPYR